MRFCYVFVIILHQLSLNLGFLSCFNNVFRTELLSFGRSPSRGGQQYGRSGGSRNYQRPDYSIPIRFEKTVKIDPDIQIPVGEMNISEKTKQILFEKGFENMTPIQSQSYDLIFEGNDVVGK
jgi:hypothetical protein